MKLKFTVTIVLLALLTVWPLFAVAQDKAADTMPFVVEKIRADKKLFIAGHMQLTASEATGFWPVYERYQDELFIIRIHTVNLINDYAKAYSNMTNDIAGDLLGEFMTIERLNLKLREAYLPKLRKFLPDSKVLRYFQIENKINAALMYEFAGKIPLVKDAQ